MPESKLIQATALTHAAKVALFIRNLPFVLVGMVYVATPDSTRVGSGYFAILIAWGAYRLFTRSLSKYFTAGDVALVVVAALGQKWICASVLTHETSSPCRLIAYSTILSLAVGMRWQRSLIAVLVVTGATAIGDVIGYGQFSVTVAMLPIAWIGAVWVRRNLVRSSEAEDRAAVLARAERVRELITTARIAFEREQLATLHDTAASTLLMVADGAVGDGPLLAEQAQRDIDALGVASQAAPASQLVNLAERLRTVSREVPIPVELRVPASVEVPSVIAYAVASAAREAFNNVVRHAQATTVKLVLTDTTLDITDDGIGFDSAAATMGFGLRNSIERRLREVGGDAVISSVVGVGTTIALSWPDPGPDESRLDEPGSDARDVAGSLLRSYQYAVAIGVAVVTLEGIPLAGDVARHHFPLLVAAVTIALLCASLVTPLLVRGLGFLRWVLIPVIGALAVWYLIVLPADALPTPQSWLPTCMSWGATTLLCGWAHSKRRVWVGSLIVLGAWSVEAIVVGIRLPTIESVAFIVYSLASVATVQFAAIFFAYLLADSARAAALLGEQRVAAAAAIAVEQALQDDYQRRFAALTQQIIELLNGLADGSLLPSEPEVRRRARTEYSLLRGLFSQTAWFDHPLLTRLRPSLDDAARRGVRASLEIPARPPNVDPLHAEIAVRAVQTLVDGATDRARVVVVGNGDGAVTVSVVGDFSDASCDDAERLLESFTIDQSRTEDLVWLRIHLPVLVAA